MEPIDCAERGTNESNRYLPLDRRLGLEPALDRADVVIHVCGLALIGGKFVAVLGESSDARNFHSQICPGDWQYSLVGHRPARNRECDLGRSLSRSRCLARQQVRDAPFTQRYDDLRPCEPISERSMAVDGRFGSTKRDVALRTDDCISVRHDPKGLAARQ